MPIEPSASFFSRPSLKWFETYGYMGERITNVGAWL